MPLCLIMAAFIAIPQLAFALDDELLRQEQELRSLTHNLVKKRKLLEELKTKEGGILNTLLSLTNKIDDERASINAIQGRIIRSEYDQYILDRDVKKLGDELGTRKGQFYKRLVSLYKFGANPIVKIMIGTRNYWDFLSNLHNYKKVVAHDKVILATFATKLKEKRDKQDRLSTIVADLKHLHEEEAAASKRLELTRLVQKDMLDVVKGEEDYHQGALGELEEQARKLQSFIDEIVTGRLHPPGAPQAIEDTAKYDLQTMSLKGRFLRPTTHRTSLRYGDRADIGYGVNVVNKGLEYKAEIGDEVKAIYDGMVVYADKFQGYGLILILDHGYGLYSLSAHNSKIFKRVGDSVSKGEIIALVGDSDSIKGPSLYFELRFHGKPIDPEPWFEKHTVAGR